MSELAVMLAGEPGSIPAVQVAKMIENASVLVKSVAGGEECEPAILELSIGSARAVLEAPKAACQVIDSGLESLRESSLNCPDGWTLKALDAVNALAKLPGGTGAKPGSILEVNGKHVHVTPEIGKRAAAVKPSPPASLTDVSGVLYSYSHLSPDEPCKLRLRRDNLPKVDVTFPGNLADSAAALIEKPVTVYGLAIRDANEQVVKMDATRIEANEEYHTGAPISASELLGLWADADTTLDSVQLVRQMRDAW